MLWELWCAIGGAAACVACCILPCAVEHCEQRDVVDVSTMTTVHVRRGLRLPVQMRDVAVSVNDTLQDADPMCKICLDDVDYTMAWRKCQKCRSVYHGWCIRDWLQRKDTCPNCRTKFDLVVRAV